MEDSPGPRDMDLLIGGHRWLSRHRVMDFTLLYFGCGVILGASTVVWLHRLRGLFAFDGDLGMFYYIVSQLAMTYGMTTRGPGVDQ